MPNLLSGKRVLLLEDEFLIAVLLEDIFCDQGCIVVGSYSTVSAALAAAEGADIDLAVIDLNIGGERSYPVAEALDRRGLPFLLVTGYGVDGPFGDQSRWPTLTKPFTIVDIVGAASRLLSEVAPDPAARTTPGSESS